MTEKVNNNQQEIEQSEQIAPPADFLTYWDHYVPQLIDELITYAQSLGKPTKWGTELTKVADTMKQAAIRFAPSMREKSDTLHSYEPEQTPRQYMREVSKWYHRLGATADLSEAAPFIIPIYQKLKKGEFSGEDLIERDLLAGVLIHDLALAVDDPGLKTRLLGQAKREYLGVMQTEHKWSEKSRRDASKFLIDATFEQLFMEKAAGSVDYGEFEKRYMALQREQARQLTEISRTEYNVPTGEIFERYAILMTRHIAWRDEVHEETEIRNGTPREDEAVYPWNSAGGLFWSYDMVVKTPKGKSLIQLKSEDKSQDLEDSHYLPVVTVFTNQSRNLRLSMIPVVGALDRMYGDFDNVNAQEVDDKMVAQASSPFSSLVG